MSEANKVIEIKHKKCFMGQKLTMVSSKRIMLMLFNVLVWIQKKLNLNALCYLVFEELKKIRGAT